MADDLRRILLVEDDPDIALLAAIALEEIGGLAVRHVADPREALEVAADFAPDLAILDYRMPYLNGVELLGALRDDPRTADLPVIFMTASLMPRHVRELKERGALDVIAKPFDPLDLADRVGAIWKAR